MYFDKSPDTTALAAISQETIKNCGTDPYNQYRKQISTFIYAMSWLHGQKVYGEGKKCYEKFVELKEQFNGVLSDDKIQEFDEICGECLGERKAHIKEGVVWIVKNFNILISN